MDLWWLCLFNTRISKTYSKYLICLFLFLDLRRLLHKFFRFPSFYLTSRFWNLSWFYLLYSCFLILMAFLLFLEILNWIFSLLFSILKKHFRMNIFIRFFCEFILFAVFPLLYHFLSLIPLLPVTLFEIWPKGKIKIVFGSFYMNSKFFLL